MLFLVSVLVQYFERILWKIGILFSDVSCDDFTKFQV
jgi:hypothetical protein